MLSHCGGDDDINASNVFFRGDGVQLCEESIDKKLTTDMETPRMSGEVIYGDDSRVDIYELCDEKYVRLAQSTLALIDNSRVVNYGDGFKIQTSYFGSTYDLCSEEPFYEQGIASFCSAFLVTPDIVLTAGHCIRSQSKCHSTRFVFNYGIFETGHDPTFVGYDDVYGCQQIVHSQVNNGSDYAVIQLDRKVVGRQPLPLRESGTVSLGSPLVVIGHPSGLPTKVAMGAEVKSVNRFYFKSNLDTYGGNSGSAVFNGVTGLVEGILIRGEVDYIFDKEKQCNVSLRCYANSCSGEEITKITQVLGNIPFEQDDGSHTFMEGLTGGIK